MTVSKRFELLSSARRRAILYYLHFVEPEVKTAQLVRAIQTIEPHLSGGAENRSTQALHTHVVHAELPKLQFSELVEFDRQEQVVTYDEHEGLAGWLEEIASEELPRTFRVTKPKATPGG